MPLRSGCALHLHGNPGVGKSQLTYSWAKSAFLTKGNAYICYSCRKKAVSRVLSTASNRQSSRLIAPGSEHPIGSRTSMARRDRYQERSWFWITSSRRRWIFSDSICHGPTVKERFCFPLVHEMWRSRSQALWGNDARRSRWPEMSAE
jgi:hypothetical protein